MTISIKKVTTKKNNEEMAFVTIFDETGSIEVIIFPRIFRQTAPIWVGSKVVLLKGRVDTKDDRMSVIVENAVDLDRVINK